MLNIPTPGEDYELIVTKQFLQSLISAESSLKEISDKLYELSFIYSNIRNELLPIVDEINNLLAFITPALAELEEAAEDAIRNNNNSLLFNAPVSCVYTNMDGPITITSLGNTTFINVPDWLRWRITANKTMLQKAIENFERAITTKATREINWHRATAETNIQNILDLTPNDAKLILKILMTEYHSPD